MGPDRLPDGPANRRGAMGHPVIWMLALLSVGLIGTGVWLRERAADAPAPAERADAPAGTMPDTMPGDAAQTAAPPDPEPEPDPDPDPAPQPVEGATVPADTSGPVAAAEPEPATAPEPVREAAPEPAPEPEAAPGAEPAPEPLAPIAEAAPEHAQPRTGSPSRTEAMALGMPAGDSDAGGLLPPAAAAPEVPDPSPKAAAPGAGLLPPPRIQPAAPTGFQPVTYGAATQLERLFPPDLSLMQRALVQHHLQESSPQAYFGAVAVAGTARVVAAGGYASLDAAEAAVLALCAEHSDDCHIAAHYLPADFDGRRSGTLSYPQARVWQDFRTLPPSAPGVTRGFAWSEDGAAVAADVRDAADAAGSALAHCETVRRNRDQHPIPDDVGCRLGGLREP